MIELTHAIQTDDGLIVPAGTRLEFSGGKAKYKGRTIERKFVPLQVIKGARGPFLNACCATLLNDNRGFQQVIKKKYHDWAHCVFRGDALIVYVWDTREVIDVFTGMRDAVKGGPVTKSFKNKATGERVIKVVGHHTYGWAKSLYDMMHWPQYHRPDNGLPLVTNNKDWQAIINEFNEPVITKYAYEAKLPEGLTETDIKELSPKYREYLASVGQAMPDGSFPIASIDDLEDAVHAYGRAKDKAAVKAFIMRRAKELDAEYLVPEAWFANEDMKIVPDGAVANTHLIVLDGTVVGKIIAKNLRKAEYGHVVESDDATSEEPTDAEPAESEDKDVVNFGYLNTGDSKLTVLDNDNNEIELSVLDNDIVLEKDIIDELSKKFIATENLTHKLFNEYTGSVSGSPEDTEGLAVLYIGDLYELCQNIADAVGKMPDIEFLSDCVDILFIGGTLSLNFANGTYDAVADKDSLRKDVEQLVRLKFNGKFSSKDAKSVATEAMTNFLFGK